MLADLIAATARLGPQPAPSNAITATVTGTIISGTDQAGLFGPAGADMAGLPYAAIYTYDLSVGRRQTRATDDALYGGTRQGLPSAVTATVEVNGIVLTVVGATASGVSTGLTLSFGADDLYLGTAHTIEQEIISNGSGGFPNRLDQPVANVPLTGAGGQLYFAWYDNALRQFTSVTHGEFGPDALYSVDVPGPGKLAADPDGR